MSERTLNDVVRESVETARNSPVDVTDLQQLLDKASPFAEVRVEIPGRGIVSLTRAHLCDRDKEFPYGLLVLEVEE